MVQTIFTEQHTRDAADDRLEERPEVLVDWKLLQQVDIKGELVGDKVSRRRVDVRPKGSVGDEDIFQLGTGNIHSALAERRWVCCVEATARLLVPAVEVFEGGRSVG